MVIEYDIENQNYVLINLMINFAMFVIYTNHVKDLRINRNVNARALLNDWKYELIFYLNFVDDKKQLETFKNVLRQYSNICFI